MLIWYPLVSGRPGIRSLTRILILSKENVVWWPDTDYYPEILRLISFQTLNYLISEIKIFTSSHVCSLLSHYSGNFKYIAQQRTLHSWMDQLTTTSWMTPESLRKKIRVARKVAIISRSLSKILLILAERRNPAARATATTMYTGQRIGPSDSQVIGIDWSRMRRPETQCTHSTIIRVKIRTIIIITVPQVLAGVAANYGNKLTRNYRYREVSDIGETFG